MTRFATSLVNSCQMRFSVATPAAYEAYLQGLEHGHRETPDDQASAAALFRKAVDLDPDFGQAWAELARVSWKN